MDTNERVVNGCWRALRGEIALPTRPGLCLSLARRVVEAGLFDGHYEFYSRFLVAASSMHEGGLVAAKTDPYASDIEASMKALGLVVPFDERAAGDLIFNWQAAKPYGHVGVLIAPDIVLENINPKYRPHSLHFPSFLSLTPLEHFPVTLVARLEQDQDL